jgi:hypothetical protein
VATNYGFAKRQRELKKIKEQSEKRLKKQARKDSAGATTEATTESIPASDRGENR